MKEHDCFDHFGEFYRGNSGDYRRCDVCGSSYLWGINVMGDEVYTMDERDIYIKQAGNIYHRLGSDFVDRLRRRFR